MLHRQAEWAVNNYSEVSSGLVSDLAILKLLSIDCC